MMDSEHVLSRQEHLQKLRPFCQACDAALNRTGLSSQKCREAWRTAVAAQCVQCGIEVFGEELYALSQPPSAELASAKIGRLRLGDCARKGCNSYFYRLTFRAFGELNWPEVLETAETIQRQDESPDQTAHRPQILCRILHLPAARRLGAALLLVLVLIILRQWYVGGRIPLLREPANFVADPASIRITP